MLINWQLAVKGPKSIEGKGGSGTRWRELPPRVECVQPLDVLAGDTVDAGDVGAAADLPAVATEVLDDVAAVPEEIHDVVERRGVRQAERVSELVEAGQVDDAFAQQVVGRGAPRDLWTKPVHVGADVHRGTVAAVDDERPHLAVLAS